MYYRTFDIIDFLRDCAFVSLLEFVACGFFVTILNCSILTAGIIVLVIVFHLHRFGVDMTIQDPNKIGCIHTHEDGEWCKNYAEPGSLWCKDHQLPQTKPATFHDASFFKGVLVGMCLMTIAIFFALGIASI